MITLRKEQVISLHDRLIEHAGGESGIQDETLLESALISPFQTFEGADLYPSVQAKIARISYNLISNRPFVDGNKRTGTYVMLILLELNQIVTDFDDEEIVNIGIGVASGKINGDQLLSLIERRIPIQEKHGVWLSEELCAYG